MSTQNPAYVRAPFRERSAAGVPRPHSKFERACRRCGASFLGLAFGKTGEVGVWGEAGWWCSIECAEADGHDMRGMHQRNGHVLALSDTDWRCLSCGHVFEAAADAEAFRCGDDCTGKHHGDQP